MEIFSLKLYQLIIIFIERWIIITKKSEIIFSIPVSMFFLDTILGYSQEFNHKLLRVNSVNGQE